MGFSVKQARQYAGLTQRETAKKLGISRDSYRKMEIAPESASIALAKRFSEIVGIPIDQIFFTEKST
ncbi:MAG TPA: helix-turn-helix domain-containing protein [Firmicutes bacterium]|nr:helix-turn-helix domain-containing protein [Bacillota bacterium]